MRVMASSRLGSLSDASAERTDSFVAGLVRSLWRLWGSGSSSDFWNQSWAGSRAARSGSVVEAQLARAAVAGSEYGRRALALAGAPSPAVRTDVPYHRSGLVGVDEVYGRVARQYQYEWSQSRDDVKAREAARGRLQALADMDVRRAVEAGERAAYLASQAESDRLWAEADARAAEAESPAERAAALRDRDVVESHTAVGYRRVIHPELSRSGTCLLCVVAASQWYSVSELRPIHLLCKCTSAPVTTSSDPGLDLSRADLDAIYAAAGGSEAAFLREHHVVIQSHGENGPVLSGAGHINSESKPYVLASDDSQLTRWSDELKRTESMQDLIRRSLSEGRIEFSGGWLEGDDEQLRIFQDRADRLNSQIEALNARRVQESVERSRARSESRMSARGSDERRLRRAAAARAAAAKKESVS